MLALVCPATHANKMTSTPPWGAQVEHACSELNWRHAEDGPLGDACETLVEEKDSVLINHLTAVAMRGSPTPSDLTKGGSAPDGALVDLCGTCGSSSKTKIKTSAAARDRKKAAAIKKAEAVSKNNKKNKAEL